MTYIPARKHRLALAAATCVASLVGASNVALAAPGNGLNVFENQAAAGAAALPKTAKAGTGVVGKLNPSVLAAPVVDLTLADGTRIQAHLQRVAQDDKKGTQSWVGTFEDSPGSVLVLSKANGVVSGFANVGTETIEIVPQRDGKHVMFAVDAGKLPKTSEPVQVSSTAADVASSSDFGTGSSTLAAGDNIVQDLLVVYTANSAARYGAASLESMINSAVQSANQAYINSGVGITLNLVALKQVSLSEGSSQLATLEALRVNSEVANLRQQYGADIVSLVGENGDNCGQGYVMQSVSTGHAAYAFSSVNSGCLSNQSLAHEVGHNQGLMHDRASSPYGGSYPYSYGYRVCRTDGTGFRDIMSYPCDGAPRVLLFSTPYKTYNGWEAGIAYETNAANSAENVRSLNNTATTVASFRGSTSGGATTPPAAPSGLAVQSAAYNQVRLAWSDNSSNESGFKLERSGDGATFTEIASARGRLRCVYGFERRREIDVLLPSACLQQQRGVGVFRHGQRDDPGRAAAAPGGAGQR